ncbi:unnamed protein product, partial [Iphiclides podalirius]
MKGTTDENRVGKTDENRGFIEPIKNIVTIARFTDICETKNVFPRSSSTENFFTFNIRRFTGYIDKNKDKYKILQ